MKQRDVAEKAGISLDWYRKIEQGRAPNVSVPMLIDIGLALGLDASEIRHLVALAKLTRTAAPQSTEESQQGGGATEEDLETTVPDADGLANFFKERSVEDVAARKAIVSLASLGDAEHGSHTIHVEAVDTVGLLAGWAQAIAEEKVSIRVATVVADGKRATGLFVLERASAKQLTRIVNRLRNLPNVRLQKVS